MPLALSQSVTVHAPARLHMGFLDLNGSLGRRFGSLGLALDELAVRVTAHPGSGVTAQGPQAGRAADFGRRTLTALGLEAGAHIQVETAIPDHAGLGSGTQLALAVGTAVSRLHGIDWPARDIARTLGRGGRSGIGLGLFGQGGFLVDGGRRADQDEPPTAIARLEYPAAWRLILVFDPAFQGLHGEGEKQAFAALPKFSEESAGRLCRLALMGALPALVERDIRAFGTAVSDIQALVGDHFAPAQGGRYASPRVGRALAWLHGRGAAGIGQSSWGPTGFALVDSQVAAHGLARAARLELAGEGLQFMVCTARNRGADIHVARHPARALAV
ncbi:MAG: beta-ribofuranosylaminobenzene 5'-phosphate synthase family protein [Pseudomonadota bacterium]